MDREAPVKGSDNPKAPWGLKSSVFNPQSSALVAGLALAVVLVLLSSDSLKAVLGQAGGNLSFLRLQFSPDATRQLRERDAAGPALADPARNAYRAAQVALAPVSTCPDPATTGPMANATGPFPMNPQEVAELAKWIEANSVIPICLDAHEIDRAAAYYSWTGRALPGVQAQLPKLPTRLAAAFVDRAFDRFEKGDIEGAHTDWGRARSFLVKPYDAFGDLAESRAADHRAAQQALLAVDISRGPSNAPAR